DRVRDEPFKKIWIIRAAGSYHNDRTAVPDRQERRDWGNCGAFSKKLHPESSAGALVRKHVKRSALTQHAFQCEHGVHFRNHQVSACDAAGKKGAFKIGIVQWTNDYGKRNADQGADIGQKFPVAEMRSNEYAAAGLVMNCFCLLKKVFEVLGFVPTIPEHP